MKIRVLLIDAIFSFKFYRQIYRENSKKIWAKMFLKNFCPRIFLEVEI